MTGLLAALCLAATLPLGSVARWASAGIVMASAGLALIAWLLGAGLRAATACPPWSRSNRAIFVALIAWTLVQLIPLPPAWLDWTHPLVADTVRQLLGDATRAPLAISPFAAWSTLTLWLTYALIAFTARQILCSRLAAQRFAALLAAIGTFQALWGIVGIHSPGGAAPLVAGTTRLSGTFSSGNALGGLLILTLLPTAGLLLQTAARSSPSLSSPPPRPSGHTRWRNRWLAALLLATALAIQCVALMQTGSRGATLCGMAGLAVLLSAFAAGRNRLGRALTLVATIALVAVVATAAMNGTYAMLAQRFGHAWGSAPSAADPRLSIWAATLRLVGTFPLGVGLGGFGDAFLRFQPAGFDSARVYHAHNDWLQSLAELGFPGFLLLLAAVAVLARHLAPLHRAKTNTGTLWVWRSIAIALLATLLHALVEFNLTSRPGVAVTFFALLGAALAGADRYRPAPATTPLSPAPSPLPLALRVAAGLTLALLAAWLLARECRCAVADRLMEAGFVGMGGAPDPYAWLPAPPLSEAASLEHLQRAASLTPGNGRAHYALTRARLDAFQNRRQQVMTETLSRGVSLPPSDLRRVLATALRADEIALCRDLLPSLARAAQLAPWDADIRALRGDVRLRAAIGDRDPDAQAAAQAFSELDLAAWLAPVDLTVLPQLGRTLADVLTARPPAGLHRACRTRSWAWGRQALALTGANVDACLENWIDAGISPERLPLTPSLPADVLRALYRYFDRDAQGPAALAVLDALAQRQASTAPCPPGPAWRLQRQAAERALAYRVREQARWTLRLGRWADYRALAPARDAAFAIRLAQQTEALDNPDMSPLLVRLGLEDRRKRMGLTTPQRLHLCRLRFENGDPLAATRLLAEVALASADSELPALRSFLDASPAIPADNAGRRLAEARLLLAAGQPAQALPLLNALATDAALPANIARATRRWRANALLAGGLTAQGRELLTAIAADSPTDAPALAALIRAAGPAAPVSPAGGPTQRAVDLLTAATPPVGLGVRYLGGSVILEGLDLLRSQPEQPDQLRLFWTFHEGVPPDLAASVRLLDRAGKVSFSRQLAFDQIAPQRFGDGVPCLGETIITTLTMPTLDRAHSLLSVLLSTSDGTQIVHTDEDLFDVQVANWPAIERAPVHAQTLRLHPVVAAVDPSSGLDLAILGPEGFVARSTSDNEVMLTALTPDGLRHGERILRDALQGDSPLSPPPFPPSSPRPSPLAPAPWWRCDAPAFTMRCLYAVSSADPAVAERRRWEDAMGLTPSHPSPTTGFSHNLLRIYDPARWYREHPEWYPLRAGQRACPTNDDWQPCLSAPGIVERAVAAARDSFTRHPPPAAFSLGINDSAAWCECDACRALCPPDTRDTPASERWWSEPYWLFVNTVAARVAAEFPGRRLGAIAYGAVLHPPSVPLHPAVTVFVCQESAMHADPEARATDRELLAAWQARASTLGRYDYAGLVTWMFPRYPADELRDSLRDACRTGIRQWFMEDRSLPGLNAGLSWLVARWLWNPWQDSEALETEFCARAFGPAANAMRNYGRALQAQWDAPRTGIWLEGFDDLAAQTAHYPPESLAPLLPLLSHARAATENDPAARARVEAVAAPLDWSLALAEEAAAWRALTAATNTAAAPALRRTLAIATDRRRSTLETAADSAWAQTLRAESRWTSTLARWDTQMATAAQ
ncbi:MAG: DUF4838 domain-containing protein [Lentisphaerae bacterium]|nr:DUF4838 domain-containing protein [Lentisphaerota bacterium]